MRDHPLHPTGQDPSKETYTLGCDLSKQPAEPRVFKSHSPYKAFTNPKSGLSKGGKLIYCFRDQCDVCVSSWRFLAPMFGFSSDEIPLDAWAGGHFGPSGAKRGLNDLCDWWKARRDPRVLFLFFEEMRANHEATVRKVAAFMGREDMDAATLEKVVATTTHKSMSSPGENSLPPAASLLRKRSRRLIGGHRFAQSTITALTTTASPRCSPRSTACPGRANSRARCARTAARWARAANRTGATRRSTKLVIS